MRYEGNHIKRRKEREGRREDSLDVTLCLIILIKPGRELGDEPDTQKEEERGRAQSAQMRLCSSRSHGLSALHWR